MDLAYLWIQDGTVLVFLNLPTAILLLSDVEENLADQETTIEYSREIIGKVGWVVLLGANPVLDEARCLHKRAECVEGLHELLIRLLSTLVIIFSILLLIVEECVLDEVLILVNHLLDRTFTRCMTTTDLILQSVGIFIFKFILQGNSILLFELAFQIVHIADILCDDSLLIFSRLLFEFFGRHVSIAIAIFGTIDDFRHGRLLSLKYTYLRHRWELTRYNLSII